MPMCRGIWVFNSHRPGIKIRLILDNTMIRTLNWDCITIANLFSWPRLHAVKLGSNILSCGGIMEYGYISGKCIRALSSGELQFLMDNVHRNGNVIILTKFSLPVSQKLAKMTTVSDKSLAKLSPLPLRREASMLVATQSMVLRVMDVSAATMRTRWRLFYHGEHLSRALGKPGATWRRSARHADQRWHSRHPGVPSSRHE